MATHNQTHSIANHHAHLMIEHMPVGVALFDAHDLRLLDANPLYLSFFSEFLTPFWQHEGIIGHAPNEWLPEALASIPITALREALASGAPTRAQEFTTFYGKHSARYWNWTIDPIRDSSGQIKQLLVTTSDVTGPVVARKEAEQAQSRLIQSNILVEAERKRLEVIETVARSVRESLDIGSIGRAAIDAVYTCFNPVGVYIHTDDPSQQALRLLQIRTVPGIEREVWAILQHIPYDSPMLLAHALKQHEPTVVEDLTITSEMIEKSHSMLSLTAMRSLRSYICVPLWFKDHFEGTITAVFNKTIDPNGSEVQALQGCSTYIAAALAHARLHRTIENERARLHAVLDQLPEGILMVESSNGCISYANTAATSILGIPVSNLIGIPLNQHPQTYVEMNLHGQSLLSWKFAAISAMSGETVSTRETTVVRPDGRQIVILSSSAPIHMESGVITGVVSVFQDITAQKSIEQQKNEFLSTVSHELRTPITAIQGFAEILQLLAAQGQNLNSPYSLRAIHNISEQSQLFTRLIEEMLDISRIENDQLVIYLAPHDLVNVVIQAIESQAAIAKQHHLQLVLQGLQQTDTLMGYFDEKRIRQVLSNLISNAVKYSPVGSQIEVGLRYTQERPGEALLWVKDQGAGIPVGELPHIFKRFHRTNNSISGLGIELYLVSELVKHHNGRVWAENAEDGGSIFYVLLSLKELAQSERKSVG